MIIRLANTSALIPMTLLATAITLLMYVHCSAQVLDRVVAVVNDDIITLSDLEDEGKDYFSRVRQAAPDTTIEDKMQKAKEQILSKLINQSLINQEAKKANVRLSDQEFEQSYTKNINKLNMTREEFLKKLGETGYSEEQYREDLRSQLLRDKLVLYEVRSKIVITEEMITDYYNTEYTSEIMDGGYYILQMGFQWNDKGNVSAYSEKMAARKRAETTRELVQNGANFANIAREKSELPSAADGGDLGVFQEDEMAPYMRKAILPLKVGEISEIIETPTGYQFFKLLSTQKDDIVQQAPYDTVKEEIRVKLFEEKFAQEYKDWVQNIKERSYIKTML